MKEFEYTIKDLQGIHARPAGLLVKEASKYDCSVEISFNGKTGDAKRIFSVMSLGIKHNDTITIKLNGEDEAKALPQLEDFFKNNL